MIHPTAIVSPEAEVSESVEIGPYAIVRENVRIGDKTVIGPHAVIDPYVEMGSECQVFQFASVGAVPQSDGNKGKDQSEADGGNGNKRSALISPQVSPGKT